MRVLLDTHALLWALGQPRKLPARVSRVLRDPDTDVFVSAASSWEIAIKSALGKLEADLEDVLRECEAIGFAELPIRFRHTTRIAELPGHRRDPFDRMLVAQALEEGLTLISGDPALAAYGIPTLWR